MNDQQNVETKEMDVDLMEMLYYLLRKWWLILLTAAVALACAFAYTKIAVTPTYQSAAMLYVLPNTTSVTSVTDLQIGTAITGDFEVIATSKPVIDRAIKAIKEDSGKTFTRSEIRSMVNVSNLEDTRILVIASNSADPEDACVVANAMCEATAKRMSEITKKDPPTIVEMAEVSKSPVGPNLTRNSLIGFGIGAVAAIIVLIIRFLLNDNIITEEDVEKYLGVPTLAVIPYDKSKSD